MNKGIKNVSILLTIIIAVFAFNIDANALNVTKGNAVKDGNKISIPLNVTISADETINSLTFECSNEGTDVTCVIEENTKYGSYVNDGREYKPIGASSFEANTYNGMFKMVLTNSSNSDKEVNAELVNSFYNGNPSNSIEFSVNATVPALKKASSNASAKMIKFSKGTLSPAFNVNVTNYTLYGIQDTINSVTLSYDCAEGDCQIDIVGGSKVDLSSQKIYLDQGENTAKVIITSEDGTNSKTYTFNIIRGESSFNSAKLKDITVGDYILTPAFSKDVYEYSVNVPNKINSIKTILKAIPEDDVANVTIEGTTGLVDGENTVKITVDNVDGTETKTYTVKVIRMNAGQVEVTNYKDGKVTFLDSEDVKNTMSEDEFKVQYPDAYNKIKDGTYKFDDKGNRVVEKAEEEKDKEEPKDEKEDKPKSKTWLIIVLIVVGLAIIGVSGFFIFRKKPKDKNKKEDTETPEAETSEKVDEEKETDDVEGNNDDDSPKEENEVEVENISNVSNSDTVDIDEALQDLMSTKQYNLDDFTKENEE